MDTFADDSFLDDTFDDEELMPNSLVVVTAKHWKGVKGLPFEYGETVLYLGEIENMPGHGIFVNKKGQTHYGFHLANFSYANEDELE